MKNIKPFQILDAKEMQLFHNKSLELLETTGMRIDHDGFLEALKAKGANVSHSERTFKISSKLAEQALKEVCPESCLLNSQARTVACAANEAFDKTIAEPWKFVLAGSALEVLEDDMGTARKATFKDFERLIRFGNGHPRVSSITGPPLLISEDADGRDIPEHLLRRFTMAYMAKHCTKLGGNELWDIRDLKFAEALGKLLTSSTEAYRKNPFFMSVKCSISPFKIEKDAADVMYELSDRGLPIGIVPMPIAGATSPVTPASSVLISNTEIVGLMIALWAVDSKSFQCHGTLSSVLDMKTTIASYADPNAVLQDLALAQLIKWMYGINCWAATDYVDAKYPGAQMAMERAFKIACSVGSGAILLSTGQIRGGMVNSLEQACIDMEMFDWMHQFVKGIEVSEKTLCLNLIRSKGIGGHFTEEMHTLENFREYFHFPKLIDRSSRDGKDMIDAAREEVEDILNETPLFQREEGLCKEIDRLFEEFAK